MRIVIDARESGTSTGRYVDKLIEYLQKIDKENEYLILYKPHRIGLLTVPNFRKVVANVKEFTFAEQLKLLAQIKSLKPDLVHFPMVQQPILYRGKVVTTMQDLTTIRFTNPAKNLVVFKAKQQVYKLVNHIAAKKSVQIITPSQFVKDDVVKYTGVNPNKITVTLESADHIPDDPKPFAELKNQQFIFYLGQAHPHKNLDRLVDAFALLHKKHSGLKLVFGGKKGELYLRLEKRVKKMGLSRSVIFTDFLPEAQLRWIYENCRAYVFASLSEGFGLPPLEAMAHGAPVVSSNATCLPEINGNAAHYFDPYDVEDMAAKIEDVLTDDKLRTDLVKKGSKRIKDFSWKRMAEQTLEVYKKAMHVS